ncbi:MAG: dephospho-CoA kinase [Candidatus Limnocylindrales bacterium]
MTHSGPGRGRTPYRRGSLGTRAPLIGLIGPIGCGKSTVAGDLADRGAAVIDADRLTRDVMSPGTRVTEGILARFGEQYRQPDDSLDRAGLGRLVFSDPDRLAELEAIVHPAVEQLERDAIRASDARRPTAIALEAIKLVEAGHAPWCDEVWLVLCDPEAQLARLTGRGMIESDARQRIAAQVGSLPAWRAAATHTIRTDGSREEVALAVDAALAELLTRPR